MSSANNSLARKVVTCRQSKLHNKCSYQKILISIIFSATNFGNWKLSNIIFK